MQQKICWEFQHTSIRFQALRGILSVMPGTSELIFWVEMYSACNNTFSMSSTESYIQLNQISS